MDIGGAGREAGMTLADHERVYLDYNATAPCREEVVVDMMQVMNGGYGNPSSLHQEGQRARHLVEQSRERIATALGADASEIVFTSGGTEADNLAVFGSVIAAAGTRPHVVTSNIEHPAVLETCRAAESRGMAAATYIKCDGVASIDPDAVASSITPDTVLVSIMHANNEVGTIQPIRRIADMAHRNDVRMHCDAVQTVGRIAVNVADLDVDLLSLSGHKLGGPKGTGALYVRRGTRLAPLILGGPHERERRAGTENVPGILGLAKAVEIAVATQQAEADRLAQLRDALWQALRGLPGIHLNGDLSLCLPNTLNVSFEDLSGEDLMQSLDLAGIAVSTGSACAVGASKPSHVIEAMGGAASRGCGPLRISLGYRTTEAETTQCAQAVREAVAQLRACGQKCACVR
jgi:cysteine desulfurase